MDDTTRQIGALLAPLTNWERTREDRPRFTLDTARSLLARLGLTRPTPLAIQVGGSKGKGTTAAWLALLSEQAGIRAGVYASPHVSSIRERILLPEGPVPGPQMVDAVRRVLDTAGVANLAPSAFEVLTAAAAIVFADAAVELAIWEVGLGGRLDATTAIEIDAAILTTIELEHTQILGDTVEQIAAEKAYVLREHGQGISGVRGGAAAVIETHAARVGCRLRARDRDFGVCVSPPDAERRQSIWITEANGPMHWTSVVDANPADHDALGLAFLALRTLRPGLSLPRELVRPQLPGRFERRIDRDGEFLLLDGAHTEESAWALVRAIEDRWPAERFRVLFASARGKRWREVLRPIARIADDVVVTELPDTVSEDPATIRDWLLSEGMSARAVPALDEALTVLRSHTGPRLVTGSFHLVGAVRDGLAD
ncbi:MAG: folylpolyglutamate synthase/dihydrofolate synthase family protein [Planctomycetota bacterium]